MSNNHKTTIDSLLVQTTNQDPKKSAHYTATICAAIWDTFNSQKLGFSRITTLKSAHERGRIILATADGWAAGFLYWSQPKKSKVRIVQIATLAQYQHQGIASSMIAHLIEETDVKHYFAEVRQDLASYPFWKAIGFTAEKITESKSVKSDSKITTFTYKF